MPSLLVLSNFLQLNQQKEELSRVWMDFHSTPTGGRERE
uniref:Uncharacterized protein n=1 Tax=Arundo donax TaxID=35708 RepID=A0A0A9FT39_ARUDO